LARVILKRRFTGVTLLLTIAMVILKLKKCYLFSCAESRQGSRCRYTVQWNRDQKEELININ